MNVNQFKERLEVIKNKNSSLAIEKAKLEQAIEMSTTKLDEIKIEMNNNNVTPDTIENQISKSENEINDILSKMEKTLGINTDDNFLL